MRDQAPSTSRRAARSVLCGRTWPGGGHLGGAPSPDAMQAVPRVCSDRRCPLRLLFRGNSSAHFRQCRAKERVVRRHLPEGSWKAGAKRPLRWPAKDSRVSASSLTLEKHESGDRFAIIRTDPRFHHWGLFDRMLVKIPRILPEQPRGRYSDRPCSAEVLDHLPPGRFSDELPGGLPSLRFRRARECQALGRLLRRSPHGLCRRLGDD